MAESLPSAPAVLAPAAVSPRDAPGSLRVTVIRRATLAVSIVAAMIAGYGVTGHVVDPHIARELRSRFDNAIPFLPWTVYLYSWVYTSGLYPAFVVRSERLFARVVAAYLMVIVVSLATFIALPVSSVALRPAVSTLQLDTLAGWGVRLTYFVDPPYNLFPSLHLSMAMLAALSAGAARPLWGWLAAPIVAAIAFSICTMKQHFVVDGMAGLVLALAAWALVVRPFRAGAERASELAYGWRGPVAYVCFHGAVYGTLIIMYLAGFAPWSR